ncbi:hypothetical protein J3F84DRAFT_46125 [Trichoderma pleuroticola]
MKRHLTLLHRAAVNLYWQRRSGDSTNTAYPLPYDVPKLRTHAPYSFSWCAAATNHSCALVGCPFFPSLFWPSFWPLAVQIAEQSSLPSSCYQFASFGPTSTGTRSCGCDTPSRRQALRPALHSKFFFFGCCITLPSTLLYASTRSSLRPPSHSRRARGAQVSSPRPPGARASTPVSPLAVLVSTTIHLPGGVPSTSAARRHLKPSCHLDQPLRNNLESCSLSASLSCPISLFSLPDFFSLSLPCKGITHRPNAVDQLRHRAYLFFHSYRVPTSATTAPSSRIGPIACQAASFAPARPLRRCR